MDAAPGTDLRIIGSTSHVKNTTASSFGKELISPVKIMVEPTGAGGRATSLTNVVYTPFVITCTFAVPQLSRAKPASRSVVTMMLDDRSHTFRSYSRRQRPSLR